MGELQAFPEGEAELPGLQRSGYIGRKPVLRGPEAGVEGIIVQFLVYLVGIDEGVSNAHFQEIQRLVSYPKGGSETAEACKIIGHPHLFTGLYVEAFLYFVVHANRGAGSGREGLAESSSRQHHGQYDGNLFHPT